MIINTLGPTATDCFYAINRIKLKVDVIVLYDSFDSKSFFLSEKMV